MRFIRHHIKWIMLISGLLTCSMVFAVFAPDLAMQRSFGVSLSDPFAELLVRSWGVMVTLTGLMLIYAAVQPIHRILVLTVAALSKLALLVLIVRQGPELVAGSAPVIIIDGAMVVVFSLYLLNQYLSKHHAQP